MPEKFILRLENRNLQTNRWRHSNNIFCTVSTVAPVLVYEIENDCTAFTIYNLSNHFSIQFIVSISTFFFIKLSIYLGKYDPI